MSYDCEILNNNKQVNILLSEDCHLYEEMHRSDTRPLIRTRTACVHMPGWVHVTFRYSCHKTMTLRTDWQVWRLV